MRLAACLLALLAAPAAAQPVAFTNATIAVGEAMERVEGATLVVDGGRVVAVGQGVAVPAGARVIDARGRWITPGLIAGFSHLGLSEIHMPPETNDTAAPRSAFSAALSAEVALNPSDTTVLVNRAGGLTRAATAPAPGRALFAGQGVVVRLAGLSAADMAPAARFHYAVYGERASALAGGSRPAAWAELRQTLLEAQRFGVDPRGFGHELGRDQRLTRADAQALGPVLRGEQLLVVRADRASDLLALLTLVREFPRLRLAILGAAEGHRVAPQLAAARVPVIMLGMDNLPARFETVAATLDNVGAMAAAGVRVALGTPELDASFEPRLLRHYAGNMVGQARLGRPGLTWSQALAAITIEPARIHGLDAELGALAPGRRADVVLWDGDPLETTSAAVGLWIDGQEQSLVHRQTLLRDRYARPAGTGGLPPSYVRP